MEDLPPWLCHLHLKLWLSTYQTAHSAPAVLSECGIDVLAGIEVFVCARLRVGLCMCALERELLFFFLFFFAEHWYWALIPLLCGEETAGWTVTGNGKFFVEEVEDLPVGTGDTGNTNCVLPGREALWK